MWQTPVNRISKLFSVLLILLSMQLLNVSQADELSKSPVFARINDRVITYSEFMEIFRTAVRYKFYHGKVPQSELQAFQLKVGQDVVEQELLHQQALKLGLLPDRKKIIAGLNEYDKKYADNAEWQAQKDKNIQKLLERLERQNLIEQMQTRIKNIDKPGIAQVEQYYRNNADKFTEPRRLWLSVMLLSVPASSSSQVWIDAEKAANQFIERINKGESFADIARQYSSHPSAINGGDLGYLHEGMLEGDAKKAVEKLKHNELSQPVQVLEGITVFRLNGIKPEKLKSFNDVKERAANLLYRDMQDKAWRDYLNELNKSDDIFVNKKLYAVVDEK